MTGRTDVREVVFAVYDDMQLLDLAGPLDVFDAAAKITGGRYRMRTASLGGAPVVCSSGVRLGVDADLAALDGPLHTLVVVGGWGSTSTAATPGLAACVAGLAGRAQRVASVCTGAFVLAQAGLLDGRRATTHWAFCADLAAAHPRVDVRPDAIYVRDGPVVTAAGVSSGIDLALALIEDDHGADLARTIGRWLVVFLRRPGGQSQFSAWTRAVPVGDPALRRVVEHIAARPDADLSVPALARHAALSERHFARRFTREVGTSPGRYVERTRVRAARALLESGSAGVDAVARRCGFGSAETMRRAFLREIGVPPGSYRDRFRATGTTADR
ncbi:GlxA family transcriptional regulator [Nocardiopsis trehalosi]|jgi:transcriptional regulator GlxA family with amidase domain|uniref:GlxA family transcriptional regulator n=1 Tax=Nocardiopsis trehalosi TaxID=109329 RepID=UPI0008331E8B|nr:GlxA family transcriptional regulator [Nocardiopsis trehalosi]